MTKHDECPRCSDWRRDCTCSKNDLQNFGWTVTKDPFAKYRGWLSYWIAPLYGAGGNRPQSTGEPSAFYAPNLDSAFGMARARHSSAKGWRCLGIQDPFNPEILIQ